MCRKKIEIKRNNTDLCYKRNQQVQMGLLKATVEEGNGGFLTSLDRVSFFL